jgi:hypothetical protein
MQLIDEQYARSFVGAIKSALTRTGVEYDTIIDNYGQVAACVRRDAGYSFTIREHVRGLILAQLFSLKSWRPTAHNLHKINQIFFDYDPDKILATDVTGFVQKLSKIGCAGAGVKKQMAALQDNIATLSDFQQQYGSIDNFVVSANPVEVAKLISKRGKHKLKQVSFNLAVEYLRNVGVKAVRHDVQMRRTLSHERLALSSDYPSEPETVHILNRIAGFTHTNLIYLDTLLWLFCSASKQSVCSITPQCQLCDLQKDCQYTGREQR